jgi:hypothetical protein
MNARLPVLLIFISAALMAILSMLFKSRPEYDLTALLTANGILLILSLIAWAIQKRHAAERPQAFVRGVYGATMLRLFVCLVGIVTYAMLKRPVHKPTIFIMMGIYAVYMIVDTLAASRQARRMQ